MEMDLRVYVWFLPSKLVGERIPLVEKSRPGWVSHRGPGRQVRGTLGLIHTWVLKSHSFIPKLRRIPYNLSLGVIRNLGLRKTLRPFCSLSRSIIYTSTCVMVTETQKKEVTKLFTSTTWMKKSQNESVSQTWRPGTPPSSCNLSVSNPDVPWVSDHPFCPQVVPEGTRVHSNLCYFGKYHLLLFYDIPTHYLLD